MQELAGRVAVVTGGASGIGKAMAARFAAAGMRVVIADVEEGPLGATADELGVVAVRTDVSDAASVQALADEVVARFGTAHVLCNNAGVVGKGDPWTGPMSVWEWAIGINVYGVIHGIRSFLPIMTEQGEGHIINTASMAGLMALPGAAPYNVTKSAVVALSEGLFIELRAGGSPVRVSALCPGFVKTGLADNQPWLARHGDEPAPTTDSFRQMIDGFLRDGVEGGIDPAIVADEVITAIHEERFWILTHEDMRRLPVERMQRAERQENPA